MGYKCWNPQDNELNSLLTDISIQNFRILSRRETDAKELLNCLKKEKKLNAIFEIAQPEKPDIHLPVSEISSRNIDEDERIRNKKKSGLGSNFSLMYSNEANGFCKDFRPIKFLFRFEYLSSLRQIVTFIRFSDGSGRVL